MRVVNERVVFSAGACCPIDNGPVYLLRDADTEAWFFYAPCCGVVFREPPRGVGDTTGMILSPAELGVQRARVPKREEIASGPWAHLELVEAYDQWDVDRVDELVRADLGARPTD
jgi:hypothetical protein